jgi:transcriptional regulator with XRE-family HTH domain
MNELTIWETVAIPRRSRLYHMKPAGVGTGLVESATGYSARLAAAHSITLAVLFGYEIAPLLNKNHLRNSEARSNKKAVLANSFRTLAPAVNGHGLTAETYISALQQLTMRDDLCHLTMLPWRGIISHRHLIRPKRAWCPACYEEWNNNGDMVYEPLIWSLAVITICVLHQRQLRSRCHECDSELPLLASRACPGYCHVCKAWLGDSSSVTSKQELLNDEELEWQTWAGTQVFELLKSASTVSPLCRSSILANSISRSIRCSSFKNELAFARKIGLSQSAVNDLCRGNSAPQLLTLLKIAFSIKVPSIDLILGRIPDIEEAPVLIKSPDLQTKANKIIARPRRWSSKMIAGVRRAFEEMFETHPPLPIEQIKNRLNLSASTLYFKFPNLYQKAVARYKEYVKRRRQTFWRRIGKNLEAQLASLTPLSVSEVAREVGRSRTAVVKRFPRLCMCLSEHCLKRREAKWSNIETSLQDTLRNKALLHLKAIAKQLKVSHTSLYKRFPHLCEEIAARYALQRQQARLLKQESIRNEVRSTAISLYNQGVYPSVRKVARHLSKPISLRSNKAALASLREVHREYSLA